MTTNNNTDTLRTPATGRLNISRRICWEGLTLPAVLLLWPLVLLYLLA